METESLQALINNHEDTIKVIEEENEVLKNRVNELEENLDIFKYEALLNNYGDTIGVMQDKINELNNIISELSNNPTRGSSIDATKLRKCIIKIGHHDFEQEAFKKIVEMYEEE